MAIRFHLDEHVDSAIAAGLRRRGVDVTTTLERGLRSADDPSHIAFAKSEGRVIYTNDPDFLRLSNSGVEHCGIVFCHVGSRGIGQVIEHLALIHACMTEEEMLNRVEFC